MASTAPSRIVVRPGPGLAGSVSPPGDKSITHRAYLLGALAKGESFVEAPNPGADCDATLACLEALGTTVRRRGLGVSLGGRAGRFDVPARALECGNSGTTLRLLAGILAGQPFRASLVGDASLSRRPVDRIIEPLRLMGARLWARDGDRYPPLEIEGGRLRGIHYRVPRPSAQVASCVLLAGLHAEGATTVEIGQARDHTERMLPAFGVAVEWAGAGGASGITPRTIRGPATLKGTRLRVPGDFSAAAFFLVGAAITPGARVTATGVGANPTRIGLLRALERMGAGIEETRLADQAGEPVSEITVIGPPRLEAADIPAEWVPTLLDEVPAWAMAAAVARGTSRLEGAAELRVKESDRLRMLATNLRRLGVEADELPDGLAIRGGSVGGGVVHAAGDHRIAMAFAVLATRAQAPVEVTEAREIVTSNPDFVATMRALGAEIEASEEEPLPR